MTAMAVEFNCEDCDTVAITPNPGDLVQLDGTTEPEGVYGTDPTSGDPIKPSVEYKWVLYDLDAACTEEADCISDVEWKIDFESDEYTDALPIISFFAPTEPGQYMMVLTVTYDAIIAGLELDTECVDMTCWKFCVNDYDCPNCDDIFCDRYFCDCEQDNPECTLPTFPTDPVTYCPDWNDLLEGENGLEGICYPYAPASDGIQIDWYVVDADTIDEEMSNTELDTYLTTATIVDASDGDCWEVPNWCLTATWGSNIYQVIMKVSGPDDEGITVTTHWCPVGTIVMVEEPDAEIAEYVPPDE